MKALKTELLRKCILMQLNAAHPAAMTFEMIFTGVKINGLNCDLYELAREVEYLNLRGFLSVKKSELSAGVKRAKITAQGIDFLEGDGL